jgi:GTPase SAR1 family protein
MPAFDVRVASRSVVVFGVAVHMVNQDRGGGLVPASELIEAVSDLISRHNEQLPTSQKNVLQALQARLREPVRVAVIGRVKAGKSTMVNALLGQRVAPTDVSECTRLVTWFHYGHLQRLAIHLHDGTILDRQLAVGSVLPVELGVPVASVASLHVYLANDALRFLTIIDTPGLGSVHSDYSASTEELLEASMASAEASGRADAIVYLMNQVMLGDELELLNSLGETPTESDTAPSAARALGVLGRADQLGDGVGNPWNVAVELAEHYAGLLQDQLSTVVPVIGLLAETAEAATLTETDATALQKLGQMSDIELTKLTWSADRFVTVDAPVPTHERARLIEILALFGVRHAIALTQGGTIGAAALRRELGEISGIRSVKRSLVDLFGERDHVLKARSVLAALSRLSYSDGFTPDQANSLRNDIDQLRGSAVMQPVAEIEAWQSVLGAKVTLPEELREDLRALITPGTISNHVRAASSEPADVRAATTSALVRWRTFLNTEASTAQKSIARTVLRSYQFLWTSL